MGKGKGKKTIWSVIVRGGTLLVVLKGLRLGRLFYFIQQFFIYINIRLKLVVNNPKSKIKLSNNDIFI